MKDSILEKALLQAKVLEEAIKTNAKGILADTMKQEINSLVKESLENEMSADAETDIEEQDFGFANSDDEDENDVDSSEEDNDESDNEDSEEEMSSDDDEDSDDDDASDDFTGFSTDDTDTDMEDDSEEDSDFDAEDDEPIDMTSASDDDILKIFKKMGDEDGIIVKKEDNGDVELNVNGEEFLVKLNEDEELDAEEELDEEEIDVDEQEEEDEPLYEIVFDDEDGMDDMGMMSHDGSDLEGIDEVPSHGFDLEDGGLGDEFSDDEDFGGDLDDINLDGETSDEDEILLDDDLGMDAPEAEFHETARTLGMGNRKGALHKGTRTFNRNNVREHSELKRQVKVLKEKNEEYKKALNLFRDKLNEVAVFNANLAYATRLFTEHSTTKQEKMEILKRFDNTTTLKESQNLYKTIKGELNTKSTISENVVEKIVKTPAKGSSSKEILAESKAYTSPQFARMKDLFNKIK